MKTPNLTPFIAVQLLNDYLAGSTTAELSKRYARTPASVVSRLKTAKIYQPGRDKRGGGGTSTPAPPPVTPGVPTKPPKRPPSIPPQDPHEPDPEPASERPPICTTCFTNPCVLAGYFPNGNPAYRRCDECRDKDRADKESQ